MWQENQGVQALPVGVGVRVLRYLCVRKEGVVIVFIILCTALV